MDASHSQEPSTDLLYELNKLIEKSQFLLISLFFNLIDIGAQNLEGTNGKSLMGLKHILQGKKKYTNRAIPILQYVLELIGISGSHELKSTEEQLETCREEFKYASMIVKVCMDLDTRSFEQLRQNLCEAPLKCAQDRFKSCADLFIYLHQAGSISQFNLGLLTNRLTLINCKGIVNKHITPFTNPSADNRFPSSQQVSDQGKIVHLFLVQK